MSGESVSGRAEQLRSAASAVPSGAANELCTAIEQVRDQLAYVIGDESAEPIGYAQQLADAAAGLFRNLLSLREALNGVADYHAGAGPPPGGVGGGSGGSGGASGPPPVTARDGSKYPAAAGWAADIMPRRVRAGEPNERTTGYADGAIGQPFTSGKDEAWTPAVLDRARSVGLPGRLAQMVSTHVEMKVAAFMLQRGRQHSELVINHVPCGSQPNQRPGCHQAVSQFLPEGHTLTVHGTTQQGEPYSQTYHGRAQQ